MKKLDEALVFFDVEANDVIPETAQLLEVACHITDMDLNIVDSEGFTRTIHHNPEDVERIFASTPSRVQDMHRKNGLWDDLPNGIPLGNVDQALLSHFERYIENPWTAYVAGNSVGALDMSMLRLHLPLSYGFISYRVVDVSSFSIMSKSMFGVSPVQKTGTLHRALGDVEASIRELAFYRNLAQPRP